MEPLGLVTSSFQWDTSNPETQGQPADATGTSQCHAQHLCGLPSCAPSPPVQEEAHAAVPGLCPEGRLSPGHPVPAAPSQPETPQPAGSYAPHPRAQRNSSQEQDVSRPRTQVMGRCCTVPGRGGPALPWGHWPSGGSHHHPTPVLGTADPKRNFSLRREGVASRGAHAQSHTHGYPRQWRGAFRNPLPRRGDAAGLPGGAWGLGSPPGEEAGCRRGRSSVWSRPPLGRRPQLPHPEALKPPVLGAEGQAGTCGCCDRKWGPGSAALSLG